MDYANDFSWGAAKASHAVLCRMEHGEIQDYSQTEKIDRVRRANAQTHMPNGSGKHQNVDKKWSKTHKNHILYLF